MRQDPSGLPTFLQVLYSCLSPDFLSRFAGERRSWAAEHGQVGPPWVEAGNRDRLRRLVLTGLQPNPVFLPSVDDQLPYKLAQLIPCSDLGIHAAALFFSAKEGSNRVPFSSIAQATWSNRSTTERSARVWL